MTEPQQPNDNWRDHYDESWENWYPGVLRELSEHLKKEPHVEYLIKNMTAHKDIKVLTFLDKSSWDEGAWTNEPDKISWIDSATNLPCLILRNDFGAWCGYVGVSSGHPCFEVPHSKVRLVANRELTYSSFAWSDGIHGVSHPTEEEGNGCWWLGFSCSDYEKDVLPKMPQNPYCNSTYKTIEYVMEEVKSLARKLSEKGLIE